MTIRMSIAILSKNNWLESLSEGFLSKVTMADSIFLNPLLYYKSELKNSSSLASRGM